MKPGRVAGLVMLTLGLLLGLTAASPAQAVSPRNLYAWGINDFGPVGDGTTTDRNSPVAVTLPAGVTGFTAISAGAYHSLAIGSDGKLYAWGYNYYGELGDGTTTNRTTPVAVILPAGVTGFTAISGGGGFHSLAKGSDGKLYAWGYAYYGDLGDDDSTNKTIPVAVTLPAGVSSFTTFSAGYHHSLAIGNDGKLYAWGYNGFGELGDGTTTNQGTPVAVTLPAGVSSFTAISASGYNSLAKGSDGKLYAWGDNEDGELGDGTTTERTIPVAVTLPAGVTGFTTFSAAYNHSLAKGSDGKLYAWGNNSGDLGDGTTTSRTTPVAVTLPAGVTGFTTFSAGYRHSLAKGSDGKLYAWGINENGELGDGTFTNRTTPVAVTLPAGVTGFATFTAGYTHSLALAVSNLVVTKTSDDGSSGTLRDAVSQAYSGDTISFNLPVGSSQINLVGNGLTLSTGVTVQGTCGPTGPGIILDFSGSTGDALTLQGGDKLVGLLIRKTSPGRGLVVPLGGGGNSLQCTKVRKV